MEKEIKQTKNSLPKEEGLLYSSLLTFNLPTFIERMKYSNAWAAGELSAMVLLKSPDKQIVLAAMHDGTEITSNETSDSITLQIIEGKLKLQTGKETLALDKGHSHTLNENSSFHLTSQEETVFLLTIEGNPLHRESN